MPREASLLGVGMQQAALSHGEAEPAQVSEALTEAVGHLYPGRGSCQGT